jgi:3-oxoacyl-[acyl-carrier-protein] synthase III
VTKLERLPSRIYSVGACQPRTVVDNEEIRQYIDTSDEWIKTRSGIGSRRWAAEDETLVSLAAAAGREAIDRSGVEADRIDLVLVATCSASQFVPATACRVQAELGLTGAAFDLNAACSGFGYALGVARDLIAAGTTRYALVIGAERLTDLLDLNDRHTMFLFGDGAGACVVGPDELAGAGGLADSVAGRLGPVVWGAIGTSADAITTRPTWPEARANPEAGLPTLTMEGQQVFRWATFELPKIIPEVLSASELTLDDIDVFIPHQANTRIIDAMVTRAQLPARITVVHGVETTGNTSAASIPLAMHAALADGTVRSGQRALLLGFGAGLTYAAQVATLP